MGMRIDASQSVPAARRPVAATQSSPRSLTTGKPEPAPPPLPKAGFGAGTASQATAAYVTLGRGLYSARQMTPTTEDIQAELRAKLSEIRAQREKLEQDQETRRAEYSLPEPSPQSVEFERDAPASVKAPTEAASAPRDEARPQPAPAEPPAPTSPGARLDISA